MKKKIDITKKPKYAKKKLDSLSQDKTIEEEKSNQLTASSTETIVERDVQEKHGPTARRYQEWFPAIKVRIRQLFDRPYLPSRVAFAHWVALLLVGGCLWGIVLSVAGSGFLPGSQLFSLAALFVLAYLGGELISLLHLPPLLGMLLTGILLRNVGFIHLSGVYMKITASLREMALCIILTRAGLGLDPKALKSLSMMILRLAAIPSLVEGTFTMLLTHYLLGFPWIWGVLLGSILAAVSPAVVIPCLFSLQERGYGTSKGIPTLVVAAASLDDIFAISVFGVVLSTIFSKGDDLTSQIVRGPAGVLIGIAFGIVWGFVAHYIPHKKDDSVVILRVLMIAGGGLLAIFGSGEIGFEGAGPLGCIVLAFVACLGWRKDGWTDGHNPVADTYAVIWKVFQPILFGLIGSEVDIFVLEGSTVGYGILSLLVALFARILVSIFIAFGAGFTWKEKVFVAWAWFPKATVQAALGPVALDLARPTGNAEDIDHASKILIIAVLAILITAPLGAIIITILGPRLLTKVEPPRTSAVSGHSNADRVVAAEDAVDNSERTSLDRAPQG